MHKSIFFLVLAALSLAGNGGCHWYPTRNPDLEADLPPAHRIPNEEVKVGLPPYVIEPPDVILVDAIKVIPKVPYHLETLDIIQIDAINVLPDFPIEGGFQIEPDGTVNLGTQYGSVKVSGLTIDQAEQVIRNKLLQELRDPIVSVSILQTSGTQQISGPHQVKAQGTINLGTYGEVYVAGMTIEEAKEAIEKHLEDDLEEPEVMVDISSINSKVYYIVTDGAGAGDQVIRVPIIGGETVLDAISNIGGAPTSKDIFISRPAPDDTGIEQRLPVNWDAIAKNGVMATNYQIFPGDRIYLRGAHTTRISIFLSRIGEPVQSVSSTALLFQGAIRGFGGSLRRNTGNFGGGNVGGF